MRRWNGWGDDRHDEVLSDSARSFLTDLVDPAISPSDTSLVQVLARIAPSRLAAGSRFHIDPALRFLHARGQIFRDWVALRQGCIGPAANGVTLPETHGDAMAALNEACRLGAIEVP